jgi:CheY-like chemotaxis protein
MTVTTTSQPAVLVVGAGPAGLPSLDAVSEGPSGRVITARNNAQALAVLRKDSKSTGSPRPAIVLLNLAVNGAQAWSLLRRLKTDPQFKRIPVIVLGASNPDAERERAYEMHANSYLPPQPELHVKAVLDRMAAFWLTRVRLPTG